MPKMTIEDCYERCKEKDFDGTMVDVGELERAVQAINKLKRIEECKTIEEVMNVIDEHEAIIC